MRNMNQVKTLRTYGALGIGITTGIMGLNGLQGIIFYVFMFFFNYLFLNIKMKSNLLF
jgi:hypothetical protein